MSTVTEQQQDPQLVLNKRNGPKDPLDIYLREVESHELLGRREELECLKRLVEARDGWVQTFLHTEAALEAAWTDLQTWARGEMAASSLVPGPPRLKPGQIGPEDHVRRLYRVFSRHVARHPDRPFHYRRRRLTRRLVRAIQFVGIRPRPLMRYHDAAIARHGESLVRRVAAARERFNATRRPLIEKNLRLVLKLAWSYVPGPMSFEELIQEGNMGLMRATESFNRRFAVRFSTYAYLWIRQSIIRALEEKSRMIRLPVHLTHLLRKVSRDREEGVEVPDVVRYQGKKYRIPQILANPTVTGGMASLDAARNEEGGLAETIADDGGAQPEFGAVGKDLKNFVRKSLRVLPERLREVLRLRFGIDCQPHTLVEIGRELGVSSERIRQLQEEALTSLRNGPDAQALEELVLD